MHLADLRHRLTIKTGTTASDGVGGQTVTWATTATVWAAIDPWVGRESLQAQALQNAVQHRIVLRHRDDVTVASRLYLEPSGPTYEVVEVRDPEQRGIWLELVAVEID